MSGKNSSKKALSGKVENISAKGVSVQAIHRMPYYLEYLKKIRDKGTQMISAPVIAAEFRLSEIQVRKDLASVSSVNGKPRAGFAVSELIRDIENFLGYNNLNEAVLVGTGHLGKALLSFEGFRDYGLQIAAAFDSDKNTVGLVFSGKHVLGADSISDVCRRLNIHIGIITTPAAAAQSVCDALVSGGVTGIWNFAQTHLVAPENVLIQNVNMAASLAMLSKHLKAQNKE